MRTFYGPLICGFVLLLVACSKKPALPLSFYVMDQEVDPTRAIPTNAPTLVVSQVQAVFPEPAEGRVSIKLMPRDAAEFEKLTTDNLGKTVVVVQGTNVISMPRITGPIPVRARIMMPISTNIDFGRTYRELAKLKGQ